jgi:hypothetical protein
MIHEVGNIVDGNTEQKSSPPIENLPILGLARPPSFKDVDGMWLSGIFSLCGKY